MQIKLVSDTGPWSRYYTDGQDHRRGVSFNIGPKSE
jgi:hypothetical protein